MLRLESLDVRALLSGDLAPVIGHGGDAAKESEHATVFGLVSYSAVTNTAVADGDWDDPATWNNGVVPPSGANVLIPSGVDVVLDSVMDDVSLHTVRVDGELSLDPAVDTLLKVDTLVVDPHGHLHIGTSSEPVHSNVSARIVISDSGPIDTLWDPQQFSRGLISHGEVSIYGARTTSFAEVSMPIRKGNSYLVLAGPVVGWERGDTLVVAGVDPAHNQDEVVKVRDVLAGRVALLDRPLVYDHRTPEGGLTVHVANLTRNVVIESENTTDRSRRGHVMFMHNPAVDVNYAEFNGLGRTDKSVPLNNARLDVNGQVIKGTGSNQVGRYPVHFHRTGTSVATPPAHVQGSSVIGSPGWGVVNHSSHVLVEDNVVYNVFGASFANEAGDETGAYYRNLALRTTGAGLLERLESREALADFGFQGIGFWFQGSGTEVAGNVAIGHPRGGFVAWEDRGLVQNGVATVFPATNLPDPAMAGGRAAVLTSEVPFPVFRDNTVYASGAGVDFEYHLRTTSHGVPTTIDRLKVWNVSHEAISLPYSKTIVMKDVHLLGSRDAQHPSAGIAGNHVTANITYTNVDVRGFGVGIAAPSDGYNVISGGRLHNAYNIVITSPNMSDRSSLSGRTLIVSGNVRFNDASVSEVRLANVLDIDMRSTRTPRLAEGELAIPRYFWPDKILLDTPQFPDQQLYWPEQRPEYVPFATASNDIPQQLVGKTNRQLLTVYNLAVAGALAPASVVDAHLSGLVGPRATYPPLIVQKYASDHIRLYFATFTFDLNWPLVAGWNVVTVPIGGYTYTFFAYRSV